MTGRSPRLILDGVKTQTRRLSPYVAGTRLWVKEGWAKVPRPVEPSHICRMGPDGWGATFRVEWADPAAYAWRSPLFMPRWASRITLEIIDVRTQHVQDISDEDAIAEGIQKHRLGDYWQGATHPIKGIPKSMVTARAAFADRWEELHRKRAPWASNPPVYAITFRVIEPAGVRNG